MPIKHDNAPIRDVLIAHMRETGKDQTTIATELHTYPTRVHRYITGERMPDAPMFARIVLMYGSMELVRSVAKIKDPERRGHREKSRHD